MTLERTIYFSHRQPEKYLWRNYIRHSQIYLSLIVPRPSVLRFPLISHHIHISFVSVYTLYIIRNFRYPFALSIIFTSLCTLSLSCGNERQSN